MKWFNITKDEMVVAICKYQLESRNEILVQAIMPVLQARQTIRILNCLRKEFGDDLSNVRDKILELRLKVLAEADYKVVVPMSVNELLFGGE